MNVVLHARPACRPPHFAAPERLDEAEAQSDPTAPGVAPESTAATGSPSDDAASDEQAKSQPPSKDAAPATPQKRAYPPAAEIPTQSGPKGLRFDFNDGCRVMLPESERPWRVRLSDLDTGNILFETEMKAGRINTAKRYFIRFRLEVWQQGERLLVHDYSAKDREILIQFPIGTLGDPMGWFPYAVKFQECHGCKLTCTLSDKLIALFRDSYPHITFLTHDEVKPERYYATYSMGLFFDDKDNVFQPCDFRHVGLHRTAGYILGVDPADMPPHISLAEDSRPFPEPYVCIAVQSTPSANTGTTPTAGARSSRS
jgi:autotransporter strand-loop-strand O-heptosyltransferase